MRQVVSSIPPRGNEILIFSVPRFGNEAKSGFVSRHTTRVLRVKVLLQNSAESEGRKCLMGT